MCVPGSNCTYAGVPDRGFSDVRLFFCYQYKRHIGTMKEEVIEPLKVIDYSDKSIAVIGDTAMYRERLKELGGRFNPVLRCGPGWIFSKKNREHVDAYVKSLGGGNVKQLLMF